MNKTTSLVLSVMFLHAVAVGQPGETQISIAKLQPEAVITCPGETDWIATSKGAVWVAITPKDVISRIDPVLNRVVQQFVGSGGDEIHVGLGSVWVTDYKAGTLSRFDPKKIEALRP